MRRYSLAAASTLALSFALAAQGALAQEALTPGRDIQGVLDGSDRLASVDEGGYRYEDFEFSATAGQRFEAVMRSSDFDTVLSVRRQGDSDDASFASDDDGLGEGTNSRLRFSVDESGVYVLRARAFFEGQQGSFSLSLTERPPAPPAPEPASLSLGQTLSGELNDESPEFESGPYAAYRFSARRGEVVALAVNSDAFDPLAVVGRVGRTGTFEELARNDDGAGRGLNSLVVFEPPASGAYELRAMPLSGRGGGAFTVAMEPPPPPVEAVQIRIGGGKTSGDLTEEDIRNDSGQVADRYRFTVARNQRVRIDMASEDFDTYLELFRDSDGGLASLWSDDDGAGSGTDSRILRNLEPGSYVIEARSFGGEPGGAYTLELTEVQPDPAPTPIAFGRVVQGDISERDPDGGDGRHFDAYSFEGRQGQRVQIIMRSGDFDTYLEIGEAGDEFTALSSDDDGLGEGTDSRLTYALRTTGRYVVRASPLVRGEEGLYSIEVIDRGQEPVPGSIMVGAVARGTLSENDSIADDGGYYDAYRISAKEGEKLTITMSSNDFDALVYVGRQGEAPQDGYGDGFEVLGSDDDGLSDTHAKLEWTVEEDGEYVIRAGSFAPNSTGAYVLTVASQE